MAKRSRKPFPEECANGINNAAAYQMYISDVYLTLAYCFTEPKVMPPFAVFLEDMSVVKWDQSKEFLRFLSGRNCINSVPFVQRANIGSLGTPEEGLPYVVNLEKELTRIMEDLKTSATQARETHARFLTSLEDFLGVVKSYPKVQAPSAKARGDRSRTTTPSVPSASPPPGANRP
ncbi:Ferritin light chain, oocyte isoform [Fukomys damarensis]|uniref:Ferritin light chain, oocyte isoform n=1 Tax=Fukomys damarensis TaxID=885580 RepID=A0A091D8U8_FUKDA|nr:Ferritin light chain, oocyte isoform [Fukomys damarensis]